MAKAKVTPKGTALWAKVFKPETKFTPEGEYSVQLVLGGDAAEELQSQIDELMDNSYKSALAETGKAKVKRADPPYKDEEDKNGNSTGNLVFKFKLKGNKGKKPQVVDAKGKAITQQMDIWNGSEIKVAYTDYNWYVPTLGAGVSLQLQAVQVIKLVEGGAVDVVFDAEDGFEFEEDDNYFEEGTEVDEESDF